MLPSILAITRFLAGLAVMFLDVAQYWKDRLLSRWTSQSPRGELMHRLATACTFEEWESAAFDLDELLSVDLWRQNPTSRHYDYRLILRRVEALLSAREDGDVLTLCNLLRSGLVRNLGNITSPKLFQHAYAGTKFLIDDYITQVALSIKYVTELQTTANHHGGFTSQAKLELLHDTRQAFGRTTLVLQGGSIFGLCHLGVVKALHLQGLLPRIITGTATGALIAALVGVHAEDELLPFLNGEGIDLSAFDRRRDTHPSWWHSYLSDSLTTLLRRTRRYIQKGYFFDASVLEDCVRTNLGDLTFEEAYARSKRILNITVAISSKSGSPNLLNYLTAPNVLIWSAAVASNASSSSFYQPVTIYCKDETGAIVPWPHSQDVTFQSWHHVQYSERESPLSRIAELFNVNHFIVSQARPYIVPFLRSNLSVGDRRAPNPAFNPTSSMTRLVITELRHRLRQLDSVGLLPPPLARLLIEETIPGSSLTVVPDLSLWDFTKLYQNPTKGSLAHWIAEGERGVWPAVSAMKVRCAIEIELDRGYQVVRRRRPSAENASSTVPVPVRVPVAMPNQGVKRREEPVRDEVADV
ncbi:acyl transferase/acyl hydrolase/lysophospholipase [Aspergillus ambiguus]|uniref:triacylglycerol lipase family protein n=1 Tax=Aspergillus ambiguus TaxID=176160 RepID=UPI003CCE3D49